MSCSVSGNVEMRVVGTGQGKARQVGEITKQREQLERGP